jgi:tRNA (guanine37-N1)-methyltransferase
MTDSTPGPMPRLRVDVITLFPDLFDVPLHTSVIGRALDAGTVEVAVHDLREHGLGRHRSVDDYPYGGGAGMVLRPEPLAAAIAPLREAGAHVILLDPAGERLTDALARELAAVPHLALVCGRYEGIDERARGMVDREVSIGDYVLTGGELPALVLLDAVARLVPGVIDAESSASDSFAGGLLEHPHYTRPESFEGEDVPPVLLSGHHGEVDRWRRREALRRTLERRPDLLETAPLTELDHQMLAELREGGGSSESDRTDVRFVQLGPADEDLLRRAANLFDDPLDETSARRVLADPRSVFVLAMHGEEPVAFALALEIVSVDDARPELYIDEVGVAEAMRRRGIGRALLNELLAIAATRGCREAWVLAEPGNAAALGLYRSLAPNEDSENRIFAWHLG